MFRFVFALSLILPLQAAWLTNLDEGKALAAKEEKDIYLVFTSLKTSGACVQLEKRVLSQEVFQKAAEEGFVLVHLDVPLEMTPGVISPLAANRLVAKKYGVETYPTAFYLNSQGHSYASESETMTGGPEESAARLMVKVEKREEQRAALKLAYEKEGLARAEAIIAVLRKLASGEDPELFAGEMGELARLDPDDSLGFQKARLAEQGFRDLEAALKEVFHKDSYQEVVELVDLYVADFEPKGALLQKALFPKLAALNHGGEREAAMVAAEDVISVDPASSHGKFAAQILAGLKAK